MSDIYRKFKLGDLVIYRDTYVIPPDAVNWKLVERPHGAYMAEIAIVVAEHASYWDTEPYGNDRLYRILSLRNGLTRICSEHNLTKAYNCEEFVKD